MDWSFNVENYSMVLIIDGSSEHVAPKENSSFLDYKFATAVDRNKSLMIINILLHTCAPISVTILYTFNDN